MKRLFDIAASAAGLVVLSPILAVVALLVRKEDGGPVFYRQTRIGRHGRPFQIWKFRTMVVNADRLGPPLTADSDARITRIGRWLRKLKLDEFPQLWNVIRGEMSLVGPRPEVRRFVDQYDSDQMKVLAVRPGITDPASLTYFEEEELLAQADDPERVYVERVMPEKIRINIEYVKRAGLFSDVYVTFQTLLRIMGWRPAALAIERFSSQVETMQQARIAVRSAQHDKHSSAHEKDSGSPAPLAPWPMFDEEFALAVSNVLQSGKVNYWSGTNGREFEAEYARHTNCQHAIALSNGTVALELALHALDIGPGDEVIVPSRTFIATASSVVVSGARPVCADVDRNSQCVTAETIAPCITPRTKAVIPVHLGGWPCEMDEILSLAKAHGLYVIEDCAQAHGAQYKGQPVGSMGDVGCFSFCQEKIISTGGEGGMLVTNNRKLWEKAWRYKDHGKTPDAFYNPQPPSTQFRWLHESFGTNCRMTEMQAAIGRIALQRLPNWLDVRERNAASLAQACRKSNVLRVPSPPGYSKHAYYKFYAFVQPENLAEGWGHERILSELRSAGIPCQSGSCSEIYREDAFPDFWKPANRLPVARELGETSLMFMVHPTLTEEDINFMCRAIAEVSRRAACVAPHQRAA